MPSLHQQRLTSMLDYLEEWDKLNRTPVFDIASHQALMIWQQDVAELPGFTLNSSDESGEVWLTLDRLRPTKPPQLPVDLVPWVVVSDDPSREPHRRESIPHPTEPELEINFDDAPERETAFAAYLDKQWSEWSHHHTTTTPPPHHHRATATPPPRHDHHHPTFTTPTNSTMGDPG